MPSQHAFLSPSAAHRWLNCTPAPALERGIDDPGSDFAREGTLAHAYCAKRLKEFLHLPTDDEDNEIAELSEGYHTGEMEEYVDFYVSEVIGRYNEALSHTRDAMLLVEVQLDFSKWIPESFGTSDAVIIADGRMDVIDFKYGKGVFVKAERNPQMMIYGLGAYEFFSDEYRIVEIRHTIIQPRLGNVSDYTVSIPELISWAESVLKPRASMAFHGRGETMPGEWCQFCKAKARCRGLATKAVETVRRFESPDYVTKQEMESEILPSLPVIRTWLEGIEKFALEQALSGVTYQGFKVVAGRSVRKITSPEIVEAVLESNGYAEDSYMRPRELRTLTDLERLVGKKKFNELCGAYIEKPQGKPTLVPESDKRPPLSAADDFRDL